MKNINDKRGYLLITDLQVIHFHSLLCPFPAASCWIQLPDDVRALFLTGFSLCCLLPSEERQLEICNTGCLIFGTIWSKLLAAKYLDVIVPFFCHQCNRCRSPSLLSF